MIPTAPCSWPITPCEPCGRLDELEYGLREQIEEAAVSFLWNWTGRVFGLCEVTARPCRRDCPEAFTTYRGASGVGSGGAPFEPVLVAGEWRNVACGACGDLCSCDTVSSVRLPGPVHDVVEVRVDGAVVPASAYRVDGHARLVRDDGGSWPRCQKLGVPEGAEGTWAVAYRWGVPVPAGGQVAAGMLACEMAKAWCRDSDCSLPRRVQTVTREGVTVAVLDAFEDLQAGRTGVWLVDSWVASINEAKPRSRVYSPDSRGRGPVRTTFRGG